MSLEKVQPKTQGNCTGVGKQNAREGMKDMTRYETRVIHIKDGIGILTGKEVPRDHGK